MIALHACALFASAVFCNAAVPHPRLWFGADDVPRIAGRAANDAPFTEMAAELYKDLYSNRWVNGPADPASLYDMVDVARRHAFAYIMTGNASFCGVAASITAIITSDAFGWANVSTKGLDLYTSGSRVAAVYDWCALAWNASFARLVSDSLAAQAVVIVENGGSQQNTNSASNWQGARGSAAALCLLATDTLTPNASTALEWAVNRIRAYLISNYGDADARSGGWNIESVGYNLYPSGK